MGSKKEMFRWGKSSAPSAGEVAVQKVDKIDQVLNLAPSPRLPVYGGGGGRTSWDGGRAAKGDDIDRKAQEFINRQRSMWSLRQKPSGPSSS
ncbi:unnamed protein product [Urochloa decumbens]|uniref:Uncharacterized protein n=1 Tax=Urochloa decumbens TaxID=240449 RepID=A0ABC9GLG8_9POAL